MLEYYPIDFTKESFTFQDTEPFKSITYNNVFKSSIDEIVDLLNAPFTNATINGDAISDSDSDNIKTQYNDIFNNFNKFIYIPFNHPNDKLTKTICCSDDADVEKKLNNISTAIKKLVKSCNDKGTNNKIKCNGIKPFEAEAFTGQVKNIEELIKNSFIVNITLDKINNNSKKFNTNSVYNDITNMVDIINSESTTLNLLTIENIKLINSLIVDLVTKINELGPYDNNSYIRLFAIVKQLINIKNTLSTLNINIYTGEAPLDEIFKICQDYAKNPDPNDASHTITFPYTLPNNVSDLNYYINCNISPYEEDSIPNSLWYYYVNTDAGRKNSKWVKNDLGFSEFRLPNANNPFEIFVGKKSNFDPKTKTLWKNNPFTKYIKKVRIYMIISIILILISLITLRIVHNKNITVFIIIITCIVMFKFILLILGKGKIKLDEFNYLKNGTNGTNVVDQNEPTDSMFDYIKSTEIKNFKKKSKHLGLYNKFFFYNIKKSVTFSDFDGKTFVKNFNIKYRCWLAMTIVLGISVIVIIIIMFFYNLLEKKYVIPVLIINIITIITYIIYSKKFNDILPLELQKNKVKGLPFAIYCYLDSNDIPSNNESNNKLNEKSNNESST